MTDLSAAAHLHAGNLTDAVMVAQAAVKRAPMDLAKRVFLAELLVFSGNLERADVVMDAAAAVDSTATLVSAEFRQLLRAEMARRQMLMEGRVPEFLSDPTEAQQRQLAALVALREGDFARMAQYALQAETARPRTPGRHNDLPFDDFRDADDLLAGSFEVITSTGKYFWIPTERVVSATFHPPARLRDLLWRRASMTVADGPEGDVYVPVTYTAIEAVSDALRLGRETDWRELQEGVVRGVGQRVFLAGEDGIDIMALSALTFGS